MRRVSSAATKRHPDRGARRVGRSEHRVRALDDDVDRLGYEREASIPHERTGKQMGLAQDLEAVADAEDRSAVGRVPLDGLHDRAEPRDGARAEIITVAEAARQDHNVGALQAGVAVPDQVRVRADPLGGAQRVEIAVAPREPDDGHLEHQASSTSSR
jgi:hypothetical protein